MIKTSEFTKRVMLKVLFKLAFYKFREIPRKILGPETF